MEEGSRSNRDFELDGVLLVFIRQENSLTATMPCMTSISERLDVDLDAIDDGRTV